MWNKVRKFGLEYCDLPTMLWNVAFMLRALTLNIDSQYKEGISTIFYIITPIIAMGYFYAYLISAVWFVFWRCFETGDRLAAMIITSLGLASEIGNLKLFFMYLYRETITEIVDGYRACDALVVPDSRMFQNLMRSQRVVKKRAMAFWIVIIFNGVFYIAKALITPGRHFTEDYQVIYGLEPKYETPNYEISFMIMFAGVIWTCYLPANISALLIVLSGYTEGQMLALREELLHLWDDAENFYKSSQKMATSETVHPFIATIHNKNKLINKYIKEKLENIVKTHATNISLIRQVEGVFTGAVIVEFMILTASIIAELLGGLENTYMQIPFAFMQVSMDCLTGQRLMDASISFENAVYECKWENFDVTNMKTVLLMLQSSQKTMTLSAGGIATLSFRSLMLVIRMVYSAYTTLRTTMH